MPRGRLIFPFLAELSRLDTSATDADPDGAGPLISGYDVDFREPRKIPTIQAVPAEPESTDARQESTAIRVKAQIEPTFFEALDQLFAGDSPNSKLSIVAHYKDLELAGLVDAEGKPLIRKNDRLIAIYRLNGTLVRNIDRLPGLFVTEARDIGHGLGVGSGGSHRNLLLLTFEERVQAARG